MFFLFELIIESSGKAEILHPSNAVIFAKDATIVTTRIFNILAVFYFTLFIISCQDFVVAGAVTRWFFTRSRSSLRLTVFKSFWQLVRYHLGSISFGTLIVLIVRILRTNISETGGCWKPLACICQSFFHLIEEFLKTFSKNAYIIISLDGSSFCVAGKRACCLVSKNFMGIAAVQTVGDFVLFLARVFVVILSVLVGFLLLVVSELFSILIKGL